MLMLIWLLAMSFRGNENETMLERGMNKPTLFELPDTKYPLVVRTYFVNDNEWNVLCKKLTASYEMGFTAFVEFLSDKKNENVTPAAIVTRSKPNYKHNFIFIADSVTFSNPENTVLCIDLYDEIGKSFRVIPSELWAVENNLSIANMDFYEFFDNCDSDGVFRGFE